MTIKWKRNDIIRDKKTGTPYLVVLVIKEQPSSEPICTLVVDMTDRTETPSPILIWSRNYSNYATDKDMKATAEEDELGNFDLKWEEEPIMALF